MYCSAEGRLLYSVREPIVNRVFFSSRQRGFASKSVPLCERAQCLRCVFDTMSVVCRYRVCVRSRCWDACMVVDGGTSFEFNDGAIATISMSEEDLLRTVVLNS